MNIQIAILQNHHLGKDTHIRQIKIYGPREKTYRRLASSPYELDKTGTHYFLR